MEPDIFNRAVFAMNSATRVRVRALMDVPNGAMVTVEPLADGSMYFTVKRKQISGSLMKAARVPNRWEALSSIRLCLHWERHGIAGDARPSIAEEDVLKTYVEDMGLWNRIVRMGKRLSERSGYFCSSKIIIAASAYIYRNSTDCTLESIEETMDGVLCGSENPMLRKARFALARAVKKATRKTTPQEVIEILTTVLQNEN